MTTPDNYFSIMVANILLTFSVLLEKYIESFIDISEHLEYCRTNIGL